MKGVTPSIADLLERLSQLEQRTERAEERAARAEARAAQLESATGNLAAAVVNPKPITRRSLLTKAAVAGAAGVAGALVLNRPKDALASFTWTGGIVNAADAETTVISNSGFAAGAVLRLDANQAANGSTSIDGLQTIGTSGFSGVAAYGGNTAGTAYYGVGGAATGLGASGPGLRVYQGTHNPGGGNAGGGEATAWIVGNGASDGTGRGSALNSLGGGSFGYGGFLLGAGGTVASPNGINGGTGAYIYSGPGATGAQVLGDAYGRNPSIPAHGLQAFGNALGVGAWFYGGRAQIQIVPQGAVGAPTSGPHFAGDVYMDAAEVMWICTANGTPGTFAPLQPGGWNNALFTAVSTQQYTLSNSDGVAWSFMDATNLKLTINPKYNCQAILTGSADLWTATAGFNQDIGIFITGGAYPTVALQPEAWKESGGFAGTFSPNAAHVDTVVPLAAGTAYTIELVWKTNKAGTSLIAAGAGPIGGKFSPTRLTAWLVPTNPGGSIPRTPAVPFEAAKPDLAEPEIPKPGTR